MFLFCSIFYRVRVNNNSYNTLVINKKVTKIWTFFIYRLPFFAKTSWNGFCSDCFWWNSFFSSTLNNWIINNTSYIFIIFPTACNRIPNISFFVHLILFLIFTLTSIFFVVPLLIQVTLSTIKFTFTFAWFVIC